MREKIIDIENMSERCGNCEAWEEEAQYSSMGFCAVNGENRVRAGWCPFWEAKK